MKIKTKIAWLLVLFCVVFVFVKPTYAQTSSCTVVLKMNQTSIIADKDISIQITAANCNNTTIDIFAKDTKADKDPFRLMYTFAPKNQNENINISKQITSPSTYQIVARTRSSSGQSAQEVGATSDFTVAPKTTSADPPKTDTTTTPQKDPPTTPGNTTDKPTPPPGTEGKGNTTAPTVEQTDPNAVVGTFSPPTRFTSIGGLVVGIVNFALGLIGALAVLFIIIGGVRMVTSAGNETSIKAGKKSITWAVIGLGVAILAYTVITALETLLGRR